MLDDSMFDELKIEASEMLEESEDLLLEIEKGEDFEERYNGIFRAFHSLKGAAGMFGLDELQKHMHSLESLFEKTRDIGGVSKEQIDYFLRGIDEAKNFLNGEEINFDQLELKSFLDLGSSEIATVEEEVVIATPEEAEGEDDEYEYEYEYVEVEEEEGGDVESEEEFAKYVKKATEYKGEDYHAKVVIIDDEEDIVEILKDMMEENNHQVFAFTDGKKMLSELEDIAPDLILSDINMPELSGMELLSKVLHIRPNVPVIFISGYISKEILLDGLSKGVYGYIEKPFKEEQVVALAHQAIVRYRTQKLLNKSINYILYQYNDLDKFLLEHGKISVRDAMRAELKKILDQKKILAKLSKREI
jgi:DNA-binding response OmpR family regulator/HPt (histidine-containing phosphotransfer) domain-containing protein